MNISEIVNYLKDVSHGESTTRGWWTNEDKTNKFVVPAKLALIHSELSEALEGHRKGLMDSHIPYRSAIEVELADALIRIYDLAGFLNIDIGGAFEDKLEYNKTRKDHSKQHRESTNGKSY